MGSCETVFSERIFLSTVQSSIIAAILIVLILLSISTNLLVMVSLIKTKQLSRTCNIIYFFLSLSDCFAGLVLIPQLTLLFTYFRNSRNCRVELSAMFFAQFFAHLSGHMVVLLALYRFIFANPDLSYLLKVKEMMESRKGITGLIMFGVVFSTVYAVILCVTSIRPHFYLVSFIIFTLDFIMVFLVYILYLHAYLRVRIHVKEGRNWPSIPKGGKSRISASRPAYLLKTTKTIFLILSFIGICYLPSIVFQMVLFIKKDVTKTELSSAQRFLLYLAACIVILNSALNAIIILYRNDKINKWISNNFIRLSCNSSYFVKRQRYPQTNVIPKQGISLVITNTHASV